MRRALWMSLASLVMAVAGAPLISRCQGSVQSPPSSQRGISVRWTADGSGANRMAVEVSGLGASTLRQLRGTKRTLAGWQHLLSVYAEPDLLPKEANTQSTSSVHNLPPVVGIYSVQSGVLRFEPQFPLGPGLVYHAVFRPDRLPGRNRAAGHPISASFRIPRRMSDSRSYVSGVYPSADILPENLLKFYVHFSAPMSRGQVYDHIHLREENGKEIELPFLEINEELWDPLLTRLTLFIDPGRIKRGVLPLEEIGPALEAGKRYILVIDRELRDGAGEPLSESFQKAFAVGPPDREPPDPARWKITPPSPGTTNGVEVSFLEPMDEPLIRRMIRVTGTSGEFLEGEIKLEDSERRWLFLPDKPWQRGPHRLVIQTTLEDLAGNNIGKPFDVDLFEGIQKRLTQRTVEVTFQVR